MRAANLERIEQPPNATPSSVLGLRHTMGDVVINAEFTMD